MNQSATRLLLAHRYLQFVLDTCQAQKLQIGLKALYYLAHLSLSIVDQGLGFGKTTKSRARPLVARSIPYSRKESRAHSLLDTVPTSKSLVLILRKNTTTKDQRAQALASQVAAFLIQPIAANHVTDQPMAVIGSVRFDLGGLGTHLYCTMRDMTASAPLT